MMKRILIISMTLLLFGIHNDSYAQKNNSNKTVAPHTTVEILYFHGKQRCSTCMAIGNLTKEVVNKNFFAQTKSGQVKIKEIDISTPNGEKMADMYHVTWSSLYVNQWKNGKEKRHDMTRFGFENAGNNPEKFKSGLTGQIKMLLK